MSVSTISTPQQMVAALNIFHRLLEKKVISISSHFGKYKHFTFYRNTTYVFFNIVCEKGQMRIADILYKMRIIKTDMILNSEDSYRKILKFKITDDSILEDSLVLKEIEKINRTLSSLNYPKV